MEENLINLLEQREATAQAYLTTASKYNIPIDIFGEKIPILSLGNLNKESQELQIRSQLANFLEETKEEIPNWEGLFNRLPDKKLRLAIGLEILRDRLVEIVFTNLNNGQESLNTLESKTQSINLPKLTDEVWKTLKEEPMKETIYKEWLMAAIKPITKGPWSKIIDQKLEDTVRNGLKEKNSFLYKGALLLKDTATWAKTNQETLENRTKSIKEGTKDFDPNSPKWQSTFITRIRKEGIDLKAQIPPLSYEKTNELQKSPSIIIVGERHGANNNTSRLFEILSLGKKMGFSSLTLEEPRSTSWSSYIEFAQSIPKSINQNPPQLESKALEFCHEKGITDKSTAQKLTLIHIGRILGYKVNFVDIDEEQKKELTITRRNKNERAILDAPPTDPGDPISALGGAKVFADSIIQAYKDCLYRSKEMSKAILELSNNEKVIHIGGLLHALDMQYEISKGLGKKPIVITIDSKKSDNPITKELGKYPENKPSEGVYQFDTKTKIDNHLLESILLGNNKPIKNKIKKSQESELLIV